MGITLLLAGIGDVVSNGIYLIKDVITFLVAVFGSGATPAA